MIDNQQLETASFINNDKANLTIDITKFSNKNDHSSLPNTPIIGH